jgi:uncharacterized protein YycO
MRRGDILLVKAKMDPVGWIIRRFTHSKWNHCAWFLDKDNIIEARGRGIIISSASRYIHNKAFKYKIVRLQNISSTDLKKAMNWAIEKQEHSNWFKWLWCIILIFFDQNKPLPRQTCSGLIAESLAKVDFYFKQGKNPCRITPEDINNSKKTYKILYYGGKK